MKEENILTLTGTKSLKQNNTIKLLMGKHMKETIDNLVKEISTEASPPEKPYPLWKDPRKQKIRDLKCEIKAQKDLLIDLAKNYKIDLEGTDEKRKADKAEFDKQKELAKFKLEDSAQQLKETRLNKHNSKFFEWIPSLPNRAQRKLMRKYQ